VTFQYDISFPRWRSADLRRRGLWNDETILDYFDAAVHRRPGHTAVVDYKSTTGLREALTYEQLAKRVERIAAAFARLGIKAGDVISIQLPNWWEFTAIHLAAMRLGAVTNPLMPIFRSRELSFMLELAESRILVAPREFRGFQYRPMISDLQRALPSLQHIFFVGGDGPDAFEQLLADNGDAPRIEAVRPLADDLCQILFTSGTTGEPKGVMHTSNTLWGDVRPRVARLGLRDSDIAFMASPLAHQTGFLVGILMPIYVQGTSVLQDIWSGTKAVEILRRERATFTMASTPFLLDLTDAAEEASTNLPDFRIFIAGGAPIPSALVRRASRLLSTSIVSIWGMTECGASTATDVGDPVERSSETDGKPNPGAEIRVVDRTGMVLPPKTEGRLQVRSSGNFVGYLKRPQLNATDAEGWLDTGDLATIDSDGYVRITGRTKDVIIRGGENVPVVEIEGLLFEHPAVSEAAIVPYPDERLGERGCAFVVLRSGHNLTLPEMVEFLLSKHCTKNYLPERLEIVDEMPRTPSGKIQKFVLREQAKQNSG
jgi:cyclohexanecarboxylate-CoA ligase